MLLPVGMGTKYSHLNQVEREFLGRGLLRGESLRDIARGLGRSVSSLSRELRRNGKRVGRSRKPFYDSGMAHKSSLKRFQKSHQRGHIQNLEIKEYVTSKLLNRWSPELIAGRLSLECPTLKISHEAIYQWIYQDAPEYIPCLAKRRRQRRPRTYSLKTRGINSIPARVMINERPASINQRLEAGHWEVDLMESWLKRGAIQVICERKTRYSLLTKMTSLKGIEARQLIIKRLKNVPPPLRKTLTYDNGPENTYHVYVNNTLGTQSYFCHPYHGWEKGTVENTIGIIRRFFPKGTKLAQVPEKDIKNLEIWLNNRPRKCLGFMTPAEAFQFQRVALAP